MAFLNLILILCLSSLFQNELNTDAKIIRNLPTVTLDGLQHELRKNTVDSQEIYSNDTIVPDELDPCASEPCENGGTCTVTGTNFTCSCKAPFSGAKCEEDPCHPNLCKNGGICSIRGDSFSCECVGNYFGNRCERKCECINGKCRLTESGKEVCDCNPEYGEYYENFCKKCDCGYWVNCTFDRGYFTDDMICLCPDGKKLTNTKCPSPCSKKPCLNGGTCKEGKNSFQCDCPIPYSGITCEKDPCSENPCLNGGVCRVDNDTFQCECMTPYTGKTCEKDPCFENPCLNGGVCSADNDSFVCDCPIPYSGITCERDPCSDNPCLNGGVCTLHNVSFQCTCTFPYFGNICEKVECDCGHYGLCSFESGKKRCTCSPYTVEMNGTCVECNCGMFGNCTLEWGKKKCICGPGTIERNGKCEECDCGKHSKSCRLGWFNKKCECEDGYSDKKGTCTKCDCGIHSKSCKYNSFGKVCGCDNGYNDRNGTCTECNCGKHSFLCHFHSNGMKQCSCYQGYADINGSCTATCNRDEDCTNGTICRSVEKDKRLCECPPNFRGKMCEINVLCERLHHKCEEMGAVCVVNDSKANCQCPPGKKLDLRSLQCKDICDLFKCIHGKCEVVELDYKCRCDEGYIGEHCTEKVKTKSKNAVSWLIVLISVNTFVCFLLFGVFCLLFCKRRVLLFEQ